MLEPPSTQEAWRRYVSKGALDTRLLRPTVYRAWERSHLEGANPLLPRAESLAPLDTERLLEREGATLRAARPFLRALSAAAGSYRHAAMLSNAQAVVLEVLGDEASVQGPESVPGPGALLSEGLCGANGLGTPLAEHDYVELVGPEHFIQGFHPFTCQGIPFHDPDGHVAGALSTSVRRPEASARLREILRCAAHGIEAELLRERLERDLQRVLVASSESAEPLERLRQDVMQAQAAARLRLLTAARATARSRPEMDFHLVHQAEEAIATFRRRASLWRLLASEARDAPRALELLGCLGDLADLLFTELSVRQAHLLLEGERAFIHAEPPALYRQLFRWLMRALAQAGLGGQVRVHVWSGGLATVARSRRGAWMRLEARPAERSARLPSAFVAVEAPGHPAGLSLEPPPMPA